jgi:hypothetical protein
MSQYYDPSPTSEFFFDVANRNYPNHSVVTVFGDGTSTTDESTVWNDGGIYAYPASATQMKVSSDDDGDAQTVLIEGLDALWNQISEQVVLTGQTAKTTTKSYIRINGLTVISGVINEGSIYVGTGTVELGVPTTVYAHAMPGNGKSLSAVWSVPAGHTAYLISGSIASGTTAANKYVAAKLMLRPFGGVLTTQMVTTLATGQNSYDFKAPIRIPEKSDIEARCISSSGEDEVSTHFQFILVKE